MSGPQPHVRPLHAPYATARRPFSIGLAPLAEADWLQIDARRELELEERAAILACDPDALMQQPGTEAAAAEVLARIKDHLGRRGVAIPAPPGGASPLHAAAMAVQDDLVIMRRHGEAYRLVAAALCYPSAWSLPEKFGLPMDEIHRHVPGWPGAMADRVGRILQCLRPGPPVWRLNWSIQFGGGLRQAQDKHAASRLDRFAEPALVRVERQTLRRLDTGDILFTIKVMLDPLEVFAKHPEGPRLASALAGQLGALTPEQLAYKGLGAAREALLGELERLAAG